MGILMRYWLSYHLIESGSSAFVQTVGYKVRAFQIVPLENALKDQLWIVIYFVIYTKSLMGGPIESPIKCVARLEVRSEYKWW